MDENPVHKITLFLGNLPFGACEEEIRVMFESKGITVGAVTLPKAPEPGRNRGYGFVVIDTADPLAILRTMEGVLLRSRTLRFEVSANRT